MQIHQLLESKNLKQTHFKFYKRKRHQHLITNLNFSIFPYKCKKENRQEGRKEVWTDRKMEG